MCDPGPLQKRHEAPDTRHARSGVSVMILQTSHDDIHRILVQGACAKVLGKNALTLGGLHGLAPQALHVYTPRLISSRLVPLNRRPRPVWEQRTLKAGAVR